MNSIVIIRGESDSALEEKIQKLAKDHDHNIGGIMNDNHTEDSKAFERYEDRLAFSKAIERDARVIIIQRNFFSYI